MFIFFIQNDYQVVSSMEKTGIITSISPLIADIGTIFTLEGKNDFIFSCFSIHINNFILF